MSTAQTFCFFLVILGIESGRNWGCICRLWSLVFEPLREEKARVGRAGSTQGTGLWGTSVGSMRGRCTLPFCVITLFWWQWFAFEMRRAGVYLWFYKQIGNKYTAMTRGDYEGEVRGCLSSNLLTQPFRAFPDGTGGAWRVLRKSVAWSDWHWRTFSEAKVWDWAERGGAGSCFLCTVVVAGVLNDNVGLWCTHSL